MAKNAFQYIRDPQGALRRPTAQPHQLIGPSTAVFRTEDREEFHASLDQDAYRAAVLIRPHEESAKLTDKFNSLLGQRTDKIVITAKHDGQGFVLTTDKPEQADILQADVMEEVRSLAETYHHQVPQLTHLEIELGRNLTLGLHKHAYPVLNRVLGDSGTGWYTSDIGPDSAGEGNLFFFKGNFAHEATSYGIEEDGEAKLVAPEGRTSIIVRPNMVHFQNVLDEARAAAGLS